MRSFYLALHVALNVALLGLFTVLVSPLAKADSQNGSAFVYPTSEHPSIFIERLLEYQTSSAAVASRSATVTPVEQHFDPKALGTLRPVDEQKLANLAAAVEQHNWALVSSYFPAEHIEGQLDMYLQDTFMFNNLGAPKGRDLLNALKLYIGENLRLYMRGKDLKDINQITSMRYTSVEINPRRPHKATVHFLVTKLGNQTVSGALNMNILTGKLTPPVG